MGMSGHYRVYRVNRYATDIRLHVDSTHPRLQSDREVGEREDEKTRKRTMMARSVMPQPTYHQYQWAPTGREPKATEIRATNTTYS